jgi:hypothetical protein
MTTTKTRKTVPAEKVRVGDFIPDLANAYVIEVEETECSAFTGRYNVILGTYTVVTYNDADGDEGYLLLTPATTVTIER